MSRCPRRRTAQAEQRGRGALARSTARWPTFWRASAASAALAVGVITPALLLTAGTAHARPEEAEQIRARLVDGDPGTWPTVLAPLEKSATQVGAVLGPLLRDRSPKAAPASAFAAAWLTERVGRDGEILLGEDIVARAKDDPTWVAAVRRTLATEGKRDPKSFATLLAFARTRFRQADQDPILGAEAAWLLRYTDDREVAVELASAWDTGVGGVRTAAAESLARALAFRFDSAAAAHTFFSEHKDVAFAEWVRILSMRKDAPESELYRRLLREASANIDRIEKLEALEPYLLSTETRWVGLRRLAARRAQKVEASPDAWVALLQRVLATEDDPETVTTLLELADRLPSAPRPVDDPFLLLIQERLRECCSLAPSIAPSITKGLLRVLGKVGGPRDVELSFQVLPATASTDVLDTLLTVAGQVGGVERRLLEFHASRLPRDGRPDEADAVALRARALEALAHGGDRKPKPVAALASAYLCAVLIGADPAGREPAPAARRAAIRGLDGFPSPETADCLKTLIVTPGEDPSLARLAASVLGRLAPRDATARARLIEIAGLPTASEARTEALKDLGGLAADATEETRAAVVPLLRTALSAPDRETRVASASSLVSWLDGESLPALFTAVVEAFKGRETLDDPEKPLLAALERLVEGLAKGDGSDDAAIAEGVLRLGSAGAVEPALKMATLAATVGSGRLQLQTSRAELLRLRAGRTPRDPEARRADLETAFKALKYAVKAAADAGERGGAWPRALLATLAIANDLGDPGAIAEALTLADLAKDATLSVAEQAELDRLLALLRRGPPAPPR